MPSGSAAVARAAGSGCGCGATAAPVPGCGWRCGSLVMDVAQAYQPEQFAAKARHVAQDAVGSLRDAEQELVRSLDGGGNSTSSRR